MVTHEAITIDYVKFDSHNNFGYCRGMDRGGVRRVPPPPLSCRFLQLSCRFLQAPGTPIFFLKITFRPPAPPWQKAAHAPASDFRVRTPHSAPQGDIPPLLAKKIKLI